MCCDSKYAVNLSCDPQRTDGAHLAAEPLLVNDAQLFHWLTELTEEYAVVFQNGGIYLTFQVYQMG